MTIATTAPTEIVELRLAAQLISHTTVTQASEVVRWLGAVQAQDYSSALWAIGLRLKEAREEDVVDALAKREIVRTWPMRVTLHLVAAHDARWMTEVLAPRPAAAAAGRLRSLGIDEAVLVAARRVLVRLRPPSRRRSVSKSRTFTWPSAARRSQAIKKVLDATPSHEQQEATSPPPDDKPRGRTRKTPPTGRRDVPVVFPAAHRHEAERAAGTDSRRAHFVRRALERQTI